MSPSSSNYKNNEFGPEDEDLTYRRQTNTNAEHGAPRPSNMPARKNRRRSKRKSAAAPNGIQKRRNKHWSW